MTRWVSLSVRASSANTDDSSPARKSSAWFGKSATLVVLDSNIWISAFVEERGPSAALIAKATARAFNTLTVHAQVEELLRGFQTGADPEWFAHYGQAARDAILTTCQLEPNARNDLPEQPGVHPVDRLLASLALQNNATLVTGDKRLLEYARKQSVQAMTPKAFLSLF